ncbi:hypothetical protein ABBQ38_006745 [Trebouxia sp. C0009 RCD-2024]
MHATARADSSTSLARFRKQIAAMVNASLTTQFRPIDARSAWKSSQYTGNKDWLVTLKQQHLDELRAAVTLHKNVSEAQLHELRTSDFPLPTLGPVLHEVRDETVQGRGFAVVQGLPTRDYSPRDLIVAYWAVANYLGNVQVTNKHGHLVGHVKNHGRDPNHPQTRLYSTNAAQPYHCDRGADIIGLCCVHQAKSGGLSSWASSSAVYNELLQHRPDIIQTLSEPFYTDRKGEIPEGKKGYYQMPVVHAHDGLVTINYGGDFIQSAQRNFPDVPRLTPQQVEAMQLLEQTAARDDFRMDYDLQPGDMQFINNHTILHARGAFEDWEDEKDGGKRHLLRTWISPPNGRPLPAVFADQWASMEPGNRGGIRVPGATPHISVAADK